MKKCFGIISWFPDIEPNRKQRIERLNNTFKELINNFGENIEFLIVAQNWKDYEVPSFIKNKIIFKYNKLGILGARKTLRKHFLESKYDYLIMCDDDIILDFEKGYSGKDFLNDLDKHPKGFGFISYGWSLTFCAISKYIYEKEDMIDLNPELGEGYEDTGFACLLHYRFPENEFKINKIKFLQHKGEFHKNHRSTWEATKKATHQQLKFLTDYHVENFKKGIFDLDKAGALNAWKNRPKTELDIYIENYMANNSKKDKVVDKENSLKDFPSLDDYLF